MVFALVHFTVGFVAILAVLSALPITRYRLTGAYLGGIWALLPDARFLVDGVLGQRFEALHDGPRAAIFFLHSTLDSDPFRAHSVELTFLSLLVLGTAFVAYDWRFGHGRSVVWRLGRTDASDEPP